MPDETQAFVVGLPADRRASIGKAKRDSYVRLVFDSWDRAAPLSPDAHNASLMTYVRCRSAIEYCLFARMARDNGRSSIPHAAAPCRRCLFNLRALSRARFISATVISSRIFNVGDTASAQPASSQPLLRSFDFGFAASDARRPRHRLHPFASELLPHR